MPPPIAISECHFTNDRFCVACDSLQFTIETVGAVKGVSQIARRTDASCTGMSKCRMVSVPNSVIGN